MKEGLIGGSVSTKKGAAHPKKTKKRGNVIKLYAFALAVGRSSEKEWLYGTCGTGCS